jgi:hypothetical protein
MAFDNEHPQPYDGAPDGGLPAGSDAEYTTLLHRGVEAVNAIDQTAVALQSVYADYPYLRPANLSKHLAADQTYVSLLRGNTVTAAFDRDYEPKTPDFIRKVWGTEIGAQLGGLQASGNTPAYQRLINRQHFRIVAAANLITGLKLFAYSTVQAVAEENPDYGLSTRALVTYQETVLPEHCLPELVAPPLYLTHLAANVQNFNATSVVPSGLEATLLGSRSKSLKAQQNVLNKQRISESIGAYIARRYEDEDLARNRKLASVLIECDLAERQEAQDPPYPVLYGIANRMRLIASHYHITSHQLPGAAVETFEKFTFEA